MTRELKETKRNKEQRENVEGGIYRYKAIELQQVQFTGMRWVDFSAT